MFTEQLNIIRRNHKSQAVQHVRQSNNPELFQADIQYQIYGTFMKHIGQKLSLKESQLIESSKIFIDKYSLLFKKSIQSSRTLDTMMEEAFDVSEALEEDRNINLNRKNGNSLTSRKNIQQFSEQLNEIQRNCSYACFNFFTILVAEYKKMESKIKQLDSKQIILTRIMQQKYKMHEQNIILKKKLEHQKQSIQNLQNQIKNLTEKNKSMHSVMQEKINSINCNNRYFEINNKVYKDIKNYLHQKQNLLKSQHQRIIQTQNNVLKSIQEAFNDGSCIKCCDILRKLKESIIKYKKYLQVESIQFEKLYDKYKKTMYALKSRQSL